MQSLEPHINHHIERLQAEAEHGRLIKLVPSPIPVRRSVASRSRRLVAITAGVAATILMVAVAAYGYDAGPTTSAAPSLEPGPLSNEPDPTQPVATDPPLHPGGAGVLLPR